MKTNWYRGATATKASKAWALPKYWVTVNPISIRGADYAHHNTMGLGWLKFALASLKLMCFDRNINGNRNVKFLECDYLLSSIECIVVLLKLN